MHNIVPIRTKSSEISKSHLEQLMKSRNLNNSQMAKILGVEGWTIGAWLSSKREISEKYKEKVCELLKLPETSDLLIAPAVMNLTNQIAKVNDENELHLIVDALVRTVKHVSYKLSEFSFHKVSQNEILALTKFLKSCDDISICQINETVASLINERVHVSSLSAEEYARYCIGCAEKDKLNQELLLELDSRSLFAHYSLHFDIDEEMGNWSSQIDKTFGHKYDPRDPHASGSIFNEETGKFQLEDEDYEEVLTWIKDSHKERVIAMAIALFKDTTFEDDLMNDQWVSESIFSVTYKISLDDPKFKESLKILMNRQIIN